MTDVLVDLIMPGLVMAGMVTVDAYFAWVLIFGGEE